MYKRIFGIVVLLMVFGMVLSACGGSGGGSSASTSITVVMTDFKFDPASVTVPAGKQITLNLTNKGSVAHDFVLMSKPVTSSFTDADKANILFQKEEPAGASETLTFTSPAAPGEYQIVCSVAGHFEAGMVAKLVVVQ